MGGRVLHVLVAAAAVVVLAAVGADHAASGSGVSEARSGGIFRISLNAASGIDYLDPALASTPPAWALLDTTCARLSRTPTRPARGFRLVPEVAASSRRSRTTARRTRSRSARGFRFSDGSRARERVRTGDQPCARSCDALARGPIRPRHRRRRQVVSGRTTAASGVVARGNTLVVRFTRPAPDFPQRMATTFFCAVPPTLPDRPRGSRAPSPRQARTTSSEYRPANGS